MPSEMNRIRRRLAWAFVCALGLHALPALLLATRASESRALQFEGRASLAAVLARPRTRGTAVTGSAAASQTRSTQPGERRFSSDAVQELSRLLQERIVYPELARKYGWEGVVEITALVGADGRCSRATVSRSSGYSMLDQEARRAVLAYGFPAGARSEQARFRFRFALY